MIPKVIHYCWFGGKPLPPLAEKCIASWKKYCPDYEIVRWDESNYDYKKSDYMRQAYEAKKWSFVTDYARKDIIYENGGIYLDTDVELIKPIDDLLSHTAFLGMEKPGYVATGLIMGAEKHNEIIGEMRDVYNNVRFMNEDGSLNLKTCLEYEREVLQKHGLRDENTEQVINGIHIYPTEYFCPKAGYGTDIKVTKKTYSIHHYAASWVPLNRKIRGKVYFGLKRIFGKHAADAVRKIIGRK